MRTSFDRKLVNNIMYQRYGLCKTMFWILTCFSILTTVKSGLISTVSCPDNFCICTNYRASCSNHGEKLTYIPKLPQTIRFLNFSGNRLTSVNKGTFEFIRNLTLQYLYLQRNSMSYISQDAFEMLPDLIELNLRGNYMSVFIIKNSFYGLRSSKLKSLNLENMKISFLPSDMFKALQNSALVKIRISHNRLNVLSGSVFKSLSKLSSLDASFNNISEIDLKGFINIEKLWIRWNKLEFIPHFCNSNNSSFLPKLKLIDLGENRIASLKNNVFNGHCFPHLRNLSLDSNLFRTIGNNMFTDLPNLKRLSLTWIRSNILRLEPYAFNSSSLEDLYIGNHMQFKAGSPNIQNIFRHCPNLKTLDMTKIGLSTLNEKSLLSLFSSLRNLSKLVLQSTLLEIIPRNLFSKMPYLKNLNFKYCFIRKWDPDAFKNVKSLEYLYLDHNKITTLSENSFPEAFLNNLKHLNLKANPFSCTCDLLWFRKWIDKNKNKLLFFPSNYTCSGPTPMTGKKLLDFNPTKDECFPANPYIILGIVLSIVCAVSVITGTTIYKYRWHIKHYIYLIRSRRQYERIPGENVFVFDAFVAYHSDDRIWVISELIPHLEKGEKLRLCLHDRDFDVGDLIVDNIVDKINKSRKIILIVSNNFAKSRWCQFEVMMAQNRQIQDGGSAPIIVMLEDIKAKNTTSSLYSLLKSTTFIDWTDEDPGRLLFWRRLLSSIKSQD